MKYIIYIISLILLLVSCKEKSGYVIEGKVKGLTNNSLYIVVPSSENSQSLHVDTINTDKDGQFIYKGSSENPASVVIYMENGNVWATVWVKDKDKISFSGDAQYPELILAKGGEINDLLTEFKTQNEELLKEKRNLTDRQSSNMEQTDSLNSDHGEAGFKSKVSNLDHQLREKAVAFVEQHPTSVASLVLIQDYLIDFANPSQTQNYLEMISGDAVKSELYNELSNMNQRLLRTTIGSKAPDFKVIDIKKDTISLDTFKDKYLLLAFAASWCEICKKENQELALIRKKYGDDFLGMLTISLDENNADWLKVVEEEKLTWMQAVEANSWDSEMISLYNITSIPSNLLIDKNKIIVGRNLQAEDVIKILDKNKITKQP